MPTTWAYISGNVVQDDVPAALAEAKTAAQTQLGSLHVELYSYTWGQPNHIMTVWRYVVPDIPPPPP